MYFSFFLVVSSFGYKAEQLQLAVAVIGNKGLCSSAQVESLKHKLLNNTPVRLAANSIIKAVMKDRGGAKGCEVIISGKLKQQRAKTMKFKQGYMISTGEPKNVFIDVAIRHVFFKQGIMGCKVKIMLPYDPTGKNGPKVPIPDTVVIHDPKKEEDERDLRTPIQAPSQGQSQPQHNEWKCFSQAW